MCFKQLQTFEEDFRDIEVNRNEHVDGQFHHLVTAKEFLFVLCKHLPPDFFEEAGTAQVLDLEAVFHLFDSTNSGLIDYSEFLLFLAKHTAGSEDVILEFSFKNAEPRGEPSMRIEVLADMVAYADREAMLVAELAKETLRSFFTEPSEPIPKESFCHHFEGQAELTDAFCLSLNSCSGIAGRVEDLKNWVPTLTVDIIHKKLLPSVIALSAAKAKKRLTKTPETDCMLNLKEFKTLMIDTLKQGQEFEKDVRQITDKSSREYSVHLMLSRVFAVYHGPHHGHKPGGDMVEMGQLMIELVSEMMAESSNEEKISTFYDLLSFKFGRKVTCSDLLSAIDSAQERFAQHHVQSNEMVKKLMRMATEGGAPAVSVPKQATSKSLKSKSLTALLTSAELTSSASATVAVSGEEGGAGLDTQSASKDKTRAQTERVAVGAPRNAARSLRKEAASTR
jgi:Ca2+-binding EF-hand superfamily protein